MMAQAFKKLPNHFSNIALLLKKIKITDDKEKKH
jgi:hypothetical protein